MNKKLPDKNHLNIHANYVGVHKDESCELLKQLKMNYEDVIRVLIKIVEERDSYTKGHSENVTKLAVKVAKRLGLPKEAVDEVHEASLLHDIGKIAIDEKILNKPGPLTQEEFEKIKLHPEIGAHIVSQSHAFKHLVPGVRHHHEQYEGGGYPNPQMKHNRIPLYARIIAVADAWDAMRSDRAYRKALSKQEAMDEIRKNAGSQFDPVIAGVFLSIVV